MFGLGGWSDMRSAARSMRFGYRGAEGTNPNQAATQGMYSPTRIEDSNASEAYRSLLADHGLVGSMGRRGNSTTTLRSKVL